MGQNIKEEDVFFERETKKLVSKFTDIQVSSSAFLVSALTVQGQWEHSLGKLGTAVLITVKNYGFFLQDKFIFIPQSTD